MPQPSSSENNYVPPKIPYIQVMITTDSDLSETAKFSLNIIPEVEWHEKLAAVKENGTRIANERSKEGHVFVPKILAPREICGGDSVQLAAAIIQLDWRIGVRLKMVECAIDLISHAYTVDSLYSALPTVLKSIIEGKGLYEYGIGEFFLLYGKFEQKFHTGKGRATHDKMMELIEGDERYMKSYTKGGTARMMPLPYAVRNILAHMGTDPNTLDLEGEDIKKSIDLLRDWVERKPNQV